MKRLIALSVLSASMLSSVAAHAAATAELKLIGTITPSACVPNFTGGATINYGNIPASTLNTDTQTTLPPKATVLNITCDAPVKFALKATDERASSANTGISLPIVSDVQKFGLGHAPGNINIGAYSVQLTNVTSDTGPVRVVRSQDGGATWEWVQGFMSNDSILTSFGDSTTNNAPVAHSSITADIAVVAAVDKASNLPLADEIPIDGLATLEVVYL